MHCFMPLTQNFPGMNGFFLQARLPQQLPKGHNRRPQHQSEVLQTNPPRSEKPLQSQVNDKTQPQTPNPPMTHMQQKIDQHWCLLMCRSYQTQYCMCQSCEVSRNCLHCTKNMAFFQGELQYCASCIGVMLPNPERNVRPKQSGSNASRKQFSLPVPGGPCSQEK